MPKTIVWPDFSRSDFAPSAPMRDVVQALAWEVDRRMGSGHCTSTHSNRTNERACVTRVCAPKGQAWRALPR